MPVSTGSTLALWALFATIPSAAVPYTFDVSVQGPRSEENIRPHLEEAFAPCLESTEANVRLRAVVDRRGTGDLAFTYQLFDAERADGRGLPDEFNRLSAEAKQAALEGLDSCLHDFQLDDLKLPVIVSRRATVIEAQLVFHR